MYKLMEPIREKVRWAWRALKYENFGFWSHFTTRMVEEASEKDGLHYHLYSRSLTWDLLSLDSNGIPLYKGRLFGSYYNAGYIAWYALIHLNHFLAGFDRDGK